MNRRFEDLRVLFWIALCIAAFHGLVIIGRPISLCGGSGDVTVRGLVVFGTVLPVPVVAAIAVGKWQDLEATWQRVAAVVLACVPMVTYLRVWAYAFGVKAHYCG